MLGVRGAARRLRAGARLLVNHAREAKVADFDVACAGEENVGRLKVAVKHLRGRTGGVCCFGGVGLVARRVEVGVRLSRGLRGLSVST